MQKPANSSGPAGTPPSSVPWSVPVAVDDIPESGLHIEIDAPPATLAELKALADVRELERVTAFYDAYVELVIG